MTDTLSIAIAQLNPTVGKIAANAVQIREARTAAAQQGSDLVVCGELSLSGYPPEDLVLKKAYQAAIRQSVDALVEDTADGGPGLIIGAPWIIDDKLYNCALLLDGGKLIAVRAKHELPNYGVFDEKRVFAAGPLSGPVQFRGVRLGLMVCEDMWFADLTECLEESGAEILIVINGSPFETDKLDERLSYAIARITESGLPLIYANLVGGQDELVFDGASFILGSDHSLRARARSWQEQVMMSQWHHEANGWLCTQTDIAPSSDLMCATYQAMVLGLRDYVGKNGFPGVVLGMSGGIDSALSAAVAVDALGADKVHCIMMPSPYTSKDSLEDASACAGLLGANLDTVSIEPAMTAFDTMLAPLFSGRETDVTEENIQSRARGNLLMAVSNKLGRMVLTTGNKSEMSVGYATLYGDMCGGYSVLKDIYKTDVFALARWRNQHSPNDGLGPKGPVMPERIITKPPTAELKPDQTDQDTLPPYDVLDGILQSLIEEELSVDDLVAKGFERQTVRRVWRMLDLAEYKRRQAPPGVKTTRRAFGRDRRYPITNGFRGHI